MIREVKFRNFKGLRHVDVQLERFTVFVGPNSSGKTSVLQGLDLLAQLLSGNPPQNVMQAARSPFFCYSRNASGPMTIEVLGDVWGLRLEASAKQQLPEGVLSFESAHNHHDLWSFNFEQSFSKNGETWQGYDKSYAHFMRNAIYLRLDPALMAKPSAFEKETEKLNRDPSGKGLPSYLAYTQGNRPDEFARLQRALSDVIPAVQRIRFDRVPIQALLQQSQFPVSVLGDALVFDFLGAPDIPGHMASEGTLLVLGLLTAFMGPVRPNLVLLDDIDHGLHPKAQRDFIGVLRKLLQQNANLQIVATTHSPYLLDCLEPAEVRLTALTSEGSVACARLDEHPDFEKWKEEMTPGEFWSLIGEKWVAEREPVEA